MLTTTVYIFTSAAPDTDDEGASVSGQGSRDVHGPAVIIDGEQRHRFRRGYFVTNG
jgi:hypothetical protein